HRLRFLGDLELQTQMRGMRHRIEMVNDFKPRVFAEIINACNIEEIIEAQLVAAEARDVAQVVCSDGVAGLATELHLLRNFFAPRFLQRFEQFLRGYSHDSSPSRAGAAALFAPLFGGAARVHARAGSSIASRFGSSFANERSREIFSCNFMSPARSASGRGGQPEI